MENCSQQRAVEHAVELPTLRSLRGDKPAKIELLKKLVKGGSNLQNADAAAAHIRELFKHTSNFDVQLHALKAASKVPGAAVKCADLLFAAIDKVSAVKTTKQLIFETGLGEAMEAAGAAMAPYVDAILNKALQAPDCTCNEDALEAWGTTNGAARMALSAVWNHVTEAHLAKVLVATRDADACTRAVAIECLTTGMQRFASDHVDMVLYASNDHDELVRVEAVHSLERCIGVNWQFKRAGNLKIAKTRAEHDACKERLLVMRKDKDEEVRMSVKDSLTTLDFNNIRNAMWNARAAKRVKGESDVVQGPSDSDIEEAELFERERALKTRIRSAIAVGETVTDYVLRLKVEKTPGELDLFSPSSADDEGAHVEQFFYAMTIKDMVGRGELVKVSGENIDGKEDTWKRLK